MAVQTQSRRASLSEIRGPFDSPPHAGLWLDKYLEYQVEGGGENAKQPHFTEVAGQRVSEIYVTFFERWKNNLERAGAHLRVARAEGRLVIGLGGESVLETSVTLHHTYGVPYIPGSALKGLAAYYARNRLEQTWAKKTDAYQTLFGESGAAGYVTFFDALYVPGSVEGDRPLAPDVITVHHPDYYRGTASPPADWDDPIPIPFLSASGSYLLALHGADDWVRAAIEILTFALQENGIGAKTSSGYGRMSVSELSEMAAEFDKPSMKRPQHPQDLQPGQILKGRVQKIVGFGAFVDIGVGRDGLIHISELAESFVERVEDIVRVGQVVRVRVLTVESRKGGWRIGLSLKDVV